MQKQKRILICPLDWGLGHATRCIPIIRLLLKKNAQVIIAADGRPLALLKLEFPQLEFITFKGYDITYPGSGSMALKMLFSVRKILSGIKNEQLQLEKIIEGHKIDVVISDNRYGCHSKKVKSIFITHQLMIKTPIGESTLHKKVLKYINNYDECWVPDLDGESNLSGELAHKYPLPENTYFVGELSRFKNFLAPFEMTTKYDVMAIISGPEPQRSIFEKIISEQLKNTDLKALIVCGKTESEQKIETNGNTKIVSHLNTAEMQQAIINSKLIIARSGYSTIMDLSALGKKAVFVPTPGQTEQEYLAGLFMKRGIAYSQTQSSFDLSKALNASKDFNGFQTLETGNELEKRIDLLLA